jgi:hypothetical protein
LRVGPVGLLVGALSFLVCALGHNYVWEFGFLICGLGLLVCELRASVCVLGLLVCDFENLVCEMFFLVCYLRNSVGYLAFLVSVLAEFRLLFEILVCYLRNSEFDSGLPVCCSPNSVCEFCIVVRCLRHYAATCGIGGVTCGIPFVSWAFRL